MNTSHRITPLMWVFLVMAIVGWCSLLVCSIIHPPAGWVLVACSAELLGMIGFVAAHHYDKRRNNGKEEGKEV